MLHFLGDHLGHQLAVGKGGQEGIVADLVELLLDFTLDIDLARGAQDVDQAGPAEFSGDCFGRKRDLRQQHGELSGRARMLALLHQQITGQRDTGTLHLVPSRKRTLPFSLLYYSTARRSKRGAGKTQAD